LPLVNTFFIYFKEISMPFLYDAEIVFIAPSPFSII